MKLKKTAYLQEINSRREERRGQEVGEAPNWTQRNCQMYLTEYPLSDMTYYKRNFSASEVITLTSLPAATRLAQTVFNRTISIAIAPAPVM